MKTAFTYWDNRIAPVFDTAQRIHVVETGASGQIVGETQETLPQDIPVQKALRMVALDIGTVICGAISGSMHAMVRAYGVRVVPFVAGDLRKVVKAWLSDNLACDTFAMPGCDGRGGRRWRGACDMNKEVNDMNGKGRGRAGKGGGQGQGRRQGGQGRGCQGNFPSTAEGGICLCAKCGHREAHERSVPCMSKRCPSCGSVMTRQ